MLVHTSTACHASDMGFHALEQSWSTTAGYSRDVKPSHSQFVASLGHQDLCMVARNDEKRIRKSRKLLLKMLDRYPTIHNSMCRTCGQSKDAEKGSKLTSMCVEQATHNLQVIKYLRTSEEQLQVG